MSELIGKFHPLLVHLPIGFFLMAFAFFLFRNNTNWSVRPETLRLMLLLNFLAAAASALSGWFWSKEGFEEQLVNRHFYLAMAFTVLSLILLLSEKRGIQGWLRNALWGINLFLLVGTGHLGGSITHGEDFLTFGSSEYIRPQIQNVQEASVYPQIIEPILAETCWSCHGARSKKGGLRLDGLEQMLKGGKHGEVVLSGNPAKSDLIYRIGLEKSDEDHMPPSGKKQLTAEEILILNWWVKNGMPEAEQVAAYPQDGAVKAALESMEFREVKPVDLPKVNLKPADAALVHNLLEYGFSFVLVDAPSNLYSVSLYKSVDDPQVWEDFKKLAEHVVWFRGVGIQVDEPMTQALAGCVHAYKLDLQSCEIKAPLSAFAKLKNLRKINLTGSKLTKQDAENLMKLAALEEIYLFDTGINFSELPEIPTVHVDTGSYFLPMLSSDTSVFTRKDLEAN